MSNEPIPCPTCGQFCGDQFDQTCDELRAILAQPAEQHQGHSVVARVCAYTPGMGQVELKLPGNLPSWLELGETVTVRHGNAQHQGEPVAWFSVLREAMENAAARGNPCQLIVGAAHVAVTYHGIKWVHTQISAGNKPHPLAIEEFDEILANALGGKQ
ncbi:hypothetical protein [Pseudomonas protegens]|uniref:hypothetical protein n=1 Tax=Pseudomonas protegens TaxID=380021 RepID=UPI000C9A546E|nr:hypothetical protein [Pseudomonas protegens]PNG30983.1 hypothetical protein A1348_19185 [Pseudomonas protegens]